VESERSTRRHFQELVLHLDLAHRTLELTKPCTLRDVEWRLIIGMLLPIKVALLAGSQADEEGCTGAEPRLR